MAKIQKTETSNMEYLISLGFETDLEQLSKTTSSIKEFDSYIDKMAQSLKSYETVAKALGLDIKTMMTSLNGIKEPSQLFAKFTDGLKEAGVEFKKLNGSAIQITKAFTGMGIEVIKLSQNGSIDRWIDKSQAAIDMNKENNKTINEILDDQTKLVTKTLDIAGASKTVKEQFKKSIAEMLKSYEDVTKQQETEIINNLEQYTNKIKVEYDKQGNLVRAWVDVQVDEHTRLQQALRLFEAQDPNGKVVKAFERVGGMDIIRDLEGTRKAVVDLMNSYAALKAKSDELNTKDNLSGKQRQELESVEAKLHDVISELGKYGIGISETSGKLRAFATEQKTGFIDLEKVIDDVNQRIDENIAKQSGANYDEVLSKLKDLYKEEEKLTKEQGRADENSEQYARWQGKIEDARTAITEFKKSQEAVILDTKDLTKAESEHEKVLQEINADIASRRSDKSGHQEEIEQLTKLKNMHQELSKLKSELARKDIGTKEYKELDAQIKNLEADIKNLIESQEKNVDLHNKLITAQKQYEDAISKTNQVVESRKEDESLKEEITLIEKLVTKYQELQSIKRKNESGVTDLNPENIKLVDESLEALNEELKQHGILVDETTSQVTIQWNKVREKIELTEKAETDLLEVQKKLNEQAQKKVANDSQLKYNKELNAYIKDLKELYKAQRDLQKMEFGKAKLSDLEEQRDLVQKLKDKLNAYSDEVKNSARATEEFNKVERQSNSDLKTLENGLNRVGISFGSVFNKLSEAAKHAATFGVINKAVDLMGDAVRQSVEKVRELDQTMTNIQLVTGQTDEETRQLINTYSQMAKQLGATTKEVADG